MDLPNLNGPVPGPRARAIIERDTRVVSPSYTRCYPLVAASGDGSIVEDVDGNRFLDFNAGIAVVATGHCHPKVVQAIQEQAARLIHMSGTDFDYEEMVALAEKLSEIAPGDAELKVLKAQKNPHFLFNSLNSISALTSIDPARAREMCLLLADFLRMTLRLGEKVQIPLEQEMELLEKFLAIEKVRFASRLTMEVSVEEEAKRCLVPALLLQPLVENAVTHGIAKLTDGGTVKLHAANHGNQLTITVENSMDPDAPADRKGGMGLKNVRARLEARYGKEATVRATAEEETFRVNISLPAEYEEKA